MERPIAVVENGNSPRHQINADAASLNRAPADVTNF